ncbi:MAG: DUF5719 family protein, partial [Microbacteriaceae bacterium]
TAPLGVDAGRAAKSSREAEDEAGLLDAQQASGSPEPVTRGTVASEAVAPESEQSEHNASAATSDYFGAVVEGFELADLDTEAAAREEEDRARPVTGRKPLALASQSVLALVAIGAAVLTVGGSSVLALPTLELNPKPAVSLTPSAAKGQIVCPPSFLSYGLDPATGTVGLQSLGTLPKRVAEASFLQDVSNGLTKPGALIETPLTSPYPGTSALSVMPSDEPGAGSLLISSAQSQHISTERIAGFIASECVETRTEGWLVAGSTATGRSTVLTLANPNPVATTIELIFYGDNGRVVSRGITVAANSVYAESLASSAPNILSPVVHVTSRGGPVAAFLSETVTRVLNSGGAELVSFAPNAAVLQTIPLFALRNQNLVNQLASESSLNDARPAVRIFNPNPEPSRVRIEVLNESENYRPNVDGVVNESNPNMEGGLSEEASTRYLVDLVVPGLTSLDNYLPGFIDGNYSITLSSELPVFAAARSSNPQEIQVAAANPNAPSRIEYRADFDWAYAGSPLHGEQLIAIAEGPNPELVLTSRSDKTVTVLLSGDAIASYLAGELVSNWLELDRENGVMKATLEPGALRSLSIDSGALHLDGLSDTLLAVSYIGPAQLASYSHGERRASGAAIWVY